MKLEKIKAYNQILLAIFGSLIVIYVLVGGLFLLTELYHQIFPNRDIGEEGIVVNTSEPGDSMVSIKVQETTFLDPIQLDSGGPLFILPVSQVNLDVPENVINYEREALLNPVRSNKFTYRNYYGYFNNFCLYDDNTKKFKIIFDFKASLIQWSYLKINKEQLLLFKGSSTDNNNDDVLNHEDFQSLYIFHLSDSTLSKIELPQSTVVNVEPLPETNIISIRVGIDKNDNNKFDELREPYILYQYDIESKKTSKFIPDDIGSRLQKIIEK
jgi:hypothetical protein